MRIEQAMDWRWADEAESWIDHHGQYRNSVTVDDILSWFLQQGYVMVECSYRPMVEQYVVSLSSPMTSTVAQGPTMLSALTHAALSLRG